MFIREEAEGTVWSFWVTAVYKKVNERSEERRGHLEIWFEVGIHI